VTGGAGYVGSHACKALAARGHLPITYDNLSRGNRWAVKWGPFEQGDIADGRQIRTVLEKYRPNALMHFAAYAYVGESVEQPLLYYRNNFADTVTLLQAVVDFRRMPVVFSSSCAPAPAPCRSEPGNRTPHGRPSLAYLRVEMPRGIILTALSDRPRMRDLRQFGRRLIVFAKHPQAIRLGNLQYRRSCRPCPNLASSSATKPCRLSATSRL
jgi:UDP-glucose 4-epimerase